MMSYELPRSIKIFDTSKFVKVDVITCEPVSLRMPPTSSLSLKFHNGLLCLLIYRHLSFLIHYDQLYDLSLHNTNEWCLGVREPFSDESNIVIALGDVHYEQSLPPSVFIFFFDPYIGSFSCLNYLFRQCLNLKKKVFSSWGVTSSYRILGGISLSLVFIFPFITLGVSTKYSFLINSSVAFFKLPPHQCLNILNLDLLICVDSFTRYGYFTLASLKIYHFS